MARPRPGQPVVPIGGLTNLVQGCATREQDVGLSLARMRAIEETDPIDTHNQAARRIRELLTTIGNPPPIASIDEIDAVGHRVVDGGELFHDSTLLDDPILDRLEEGGVMAPSHAHAEEAGVSARSRRVTGDNAAVAILETAAEEDAEMIVIATHGRSGVGKWLLGSVAEKVVRGAVRPVLVVPADR